MPFVISIKNSFSIGSDDYGSMIPLDALNLEDAFVEAKLKLQGRPDKRFVIKYADCRLVDLEDGDDPADWTCQIRSAWILQLQNLEELPVESWFKEVVKINAASSEKDKQDGEREEYRRLHEKYGHER